MTWLTDFWTTSDIWCVPSGWRQGRGAWGGLVSGQVVTAASQGVPAHWAPRSMSISMMAPVPAGEVHCAVSDLRSGSAVLVRRVELSSAGVTLTTATVTFAAPRRLTSVASVANEPPPVAMADAPVVPLGGAIAPEFTGQLTFRPAIGFPYSGDSGRYTAGWIGPVAGASDPMTHAVVAAYADAWWVTALISIGPDDMADGIPPVATADFALTFPAPLSGDAVVTEAGLWHVGEIVAADSGYVTEIRRLYTSQGQLIALNTQVVAVGRKVEG